MSVNKMKIADNSLIKVRIGLLSEFLDFQYLIIFDLKSHFFQNTFSETLLVSQPEETSFVTIIFFLYFTQVIGLKFRNLEISNIHNFVFNSSREFSRSHFELGYVAG